MDCRALHQLEQELQDRRSKPHSRSNSAEMDKLCIEIKERKICHNTGLELSCDTTRTDAATV
jgi:hypothetical protein